MSNKERFFILGESDGKKVAYAIIEDFTLIEHGFKKIDTAKLDNFYEWLEEQTYGLNFYISVFVAKAVDFNNCKRSRAINNIVARTVVKTVADNNGIIYTTPSMNGWEKYFFGDKIQQAKLNREKIRIVNTIYEIGLDIDDLEVANAIMLGFAFSSNGLKKYKEGDYKL